VRTNDVIDLVPQHELGQRERLARLSVRRIEGVGRIDRQAEREVVEHALVSCRASTS
jgi:hypothetical protein